MPTQSRIKTFNKLLIANRGEIALRIIKTAKQLGLKTVAVYSRVDFESPHVSFADQSVCIGDGPVADSYLNHKKIISAAINSGSQAIHPGYGFLSENAKFAKSCMQNDLIFVGPSAASIKLMSDKAHAKNFLEKAGVPCIPGFEEKGLRFKEVLRKAMNIGFPVMVKAAAGGGGKGMRLVSSADELEKSISLAKAEARNFFGSDKIIIEKAILDAKHVEIQIFADKWQNCISLGERECSVQRRNQKLIEESPCIKMDPQLRKKMQDVSVTAASKISYTGAGTVEFLLDSKQNFYFLEMNTRLQVEHSVTELVTGLDLVEMQLEVADGQKLKLTQEDIEMSGHAIEVRLYAENPSEQYSPSNGRIEVWEEPTGDGLRVDSGIQSGQTVSTLYDGLLVKIIGKGATRDEACKILLKGLSDTILIGPEINRDFLLDILSQEGFSRGETSTDFIHKIFPRGYNKIEPQPVHYAISVVLYVFQKMERYRERSIRVPLELLGWSSQGSVSSYLKIKYLEKEVDVGIAVKGFNSISISIETQEFTFFRDQNKLLLDGKLIDIKYFYATSRHLYLFLDKLSFKFALEHSITPDNIQDSERHVVAPMPGVLVSLSVEKGNSVSIGDHIATLEAMKMQHDILATMNGIIVNMHKSEGQQVQAEELIAEIEEISEGGRDGAG